MRNEDDRVLLERPADMRVELIFGNRVERGRGFIHHRDRGAAEEGAGDGDLLRLAAREVDAPLVKFARERRVNAVVQFGKAVAEGRLVQRGGHARAILLGADAARHILRHRGGEDFVILKDRRNLGAIGGEIVGADVGAVVQDFAVRHVVEPHEQLDERGFARAVVADERNFASLVNAEGNIVQHGRAVRIGKADMTKFDALEVPRLHHTARHGGLGIQKDAQLVDIEAMVGQVGKGVEQRFQRRADAPRGGDGKGKAAERQCLCDKQLVKQQKEQSVVLDRSGGVPDHAAQRRAALVFADHASPLLEALLVELVEHRRRLADAQFLGIVRHVVHAADIVGDAARTAARHVVLVILLFDIRRADDADAGRCQDNGGDEQVEVEQDHQNRCAACQAHDHLPERVQHRVHRVVRTVYRPDEVIVKFGNLVFAEVERDRVVKQLQLQSASEHEPLPLKRDRPNKAVDKCKQGSQQSDDKDQPQDFGKRRTAVQPIENLFDIPGVENPPQGVGQCGDKKGDDKVRRNLPCGGKQPRRVAKHLCRLLLFLFVCLSHGTRPRFPDTFPPAGGTSRRMRRPLPSAPHASRSRRHCRPRAAAHGRQAPRWTGGAR